MLFGSKLAAAQAQLAAFAAFCVAAGLDQAALLKDPAAYAASLETPNQEAAATAARIAELNTEVKDTAAALASSARAEATFVKALATVGITLPADLTAEAITAAIQSAIETAAIKKAAAQVSASGHEPLPIAKGDGDGAGDTLEDIRAQLATETNPVRKGHLAARAAALREKHSPGKN
jgi:cell division protein FtsB